MMVQRMHVIFHVFFLTLFHSVCCQRFRVCTLTKTKWTNLVFMPNGEIHRWEDFDYQDDHEGEIVSGRRCPCGDDASPSYCLSYDTCKQIGSEAKGFHIECMSKDNSFQNFSESILPFVFLW